MTAVSVQEGDRVSGLVPLRPLCRARDDVSSAGGLADNHFAAQLEKVVRDPEHYPVYGDADQFFAQTYPTSGLRILLTKTFGRNYRRKRRPRRERRVRVLPRLSAAGKLTD